MLLAAIPLRAGVRPGTAAADSAFTADSGRVYRYNEIVITAERYPLSARMAGSTAYTVNAGGSGPFGGAGEALSGMRNLNIAGYGGGKALQTLSVRGMGAEHTLVLWNGMPAGNMQTGISDINLFDASALEAIQVVPGGASALYGSSAVGGVVNLLPAIPDGGARSVEVSGGTGSFGETDLSIRGEVSPDTSLGVSISLGSQRSAENYRFGAPSSGGEYTRENSDFLLRSLTVAGGWRNSASGRIGFAVSTLSLAQGAPGPWSPAAASPAARQTDNRTLAGISVEQHPSDALAVTASGLFDLQHERYSDPGPFFPADNYYRTAWAGVSGQLRYVASSGWLLQAGTDLNLARAAGNAIDRTRTRQTAAITGSVSWKTRPWNQIAAVVTPSGRAEGSSISGPHLNPKLGLNMEMEGERFSWRLHATAGSGRRSPTMNELYYAGEGGVGNPSLRDESSVSLDAGIGGETRSQGGLSWDITWYRILMTDRIQWAPTGDPFVWSPRNIGRSRSTGWEVSGDWTPVPGELEVSADYSTTDSRRGDVNPDGTISYTDQLTYVPLEKGSVSLLIGRRGVTSWCTSMTLLLRAVHTGERYIRDDNSASIPAHRLVDATFSAEFPLPAGAATFRYAPRNLGDADYEDLPGYPMPRFHHSFSITYKIRY